MTIPRAKPFVVATAGYLILLGIAVLYAGVPYAARGRADFRQLYTAGYSIRTGQSKILYDYDSQRQLQNTLVSPQDVALPFDHPAYEALLFAPLSRMAYRPAYLAFFCFNLAMLALCIYFVRFRFAPLAAIWTPLPSVIVLCFFPIAIALLQGQDSILLLALMAAALISLDNRRDALAGMLLGLGLFKFQFVLPIAILFLLWRRWRFAAGFAISGIVVGVVSVVVAGWAGTSKYGRLLISVGAGTSSSAEQYRLGVDPSAMANLRGLCYALFHSFAHAGQIATLVASIAAIAFVARRRCSFDLAILAAALVSYHGLIHDASILIIPIGVMLSDGLAESDNWRLCLGTLLLVLPSVLFMTGAEYFLLAIPMIAALATPHFSLSFAAETGG